ncbi:MAG: type II secretion system protein [Aquabacterium sp.]|uniref:type II secretion system protein n=1 Tax=Aquabacterium sp. TaxID=1872578 RepID=UPI0025C23364|nr:type II secretion system protein [Aquabacterium sp.]MBI3380392.1 type II secretion system protein [Aquabacterium sp.]
MTFTVGLKGLDVMAHHSSSGRWPTCLQAGFTYLGLLIAIAILGIGLSVVSEVWTRAADHQKRIQLEWVGQQYIQAIQSYYYANTGAVHLYPKTLEDLLEDKRFIFIKRHIRTLYPDPFTGTVQWKLLSAPQGGIQGVAIEGESGGRAFTRQFIFLPQADLSPSQSSAPRY